MKSPFLNLMFLNIKCVTFIKKQTNKNVITLNCTRLILKEICMVVNSKRHIYFDTFEFCIITRCLSKEKFSLIQSSRRIVIKK